MKTKLDCRAIWGPYLLRLVMLLAAVCSTPLYAARGNAPVSGEIQFITINDPNDHWSGGTIVVGGKALMKSNGVQ